MVARVPPALGTEPRKIKAHKKSRNGCGNCKLRSVKCDEGKPGCKRCIAYGVSCSYKPSSGSDLQVAIEWTTRMEPLAMNTLLPQSLSYWPSVSEELVSKFQARTALTVTADKRLSLYQNEILSLAYSNTYLMHAILALTLMHDRNLSRGPLAERSGPEADHWTKSVTLFNKELSRPLRPGQQAALWATAAMLGTVVFYNVDAKTPSEAWPFRPPSPNDLDWIKMNDGKKGVYDVVKFAATDPIYEPLFELHNGTLFPQASSPPDFSNLPLGFDTLFGLYGSPFTYSDDLSDITSSTFSSSPMALANPYGPALINLARVYNTGCPIITTILSFWCFVSDMSAEYKRLLGLKDPRALLLLAFWFAEIYETTVWWLVRRAKIEGMAICLYLERFHHDDPNIQVLLQYPKAVLAQGDAGG